MKKILLPLLLIFAIMLGACASASTPAATEQPTIEAVEITESTQEEPTEQDDNSKPFTDDQNPCKPFNDLDFLFPSDPNFPEITDDDWIYGPKDAPITLTVYDQFDCPGCVYLETQIPLLEEAFADKFRLVFRHFFFHENADLPARLAEAAGKQGKFFEVKEYLFNNIESWYGKTGVEFENWAKEMAEQFDLNTTQLINDFNDEEIIKKVEVQNKNSQQLGLNSTPSLYINNWKYVSMDNKVPGFDSLSIIFNIILNLKEINNKQFDSCPDMIINSQGSYTANISTIHGDIKLKLFPDIAPYAVNSFVFLANEGWYDDAPLLASDEMVLSGDPSDTTYGGPGYVYLDETNSDLNFDKPGMLAVYNHLPPGMNGSMFFINKTSLPEVEGYTIFGEVVEGLDVINQIAIRKGVNDPVIERILDVTISEE